MKNFLNGMKSVLMAAAFVAASGAAQATIVSADSNNPLGFSWSFASAAGTLSGLGSLAIAGFNSSSLSVNITLNNTSALSSNRQTSFGFGIDPNATGVTFSDANDGGMINAKLASIPSLATIEVCAFGGNNCAGGSNGGILGGGSDSFAVSLAGTWGNSVNIDPIGFKYQTGLGSFEFTTGSSSGTAVSEPGTSSMALLALGLLGVALRSRRRSKQR